MQIQVPVDDYSLRVSSADRETLQELVGASLVEFKGKKKEIEELVLTCVTNISNNTAISSELTEQGILKRAWGTIIGKNQKMRAVLYKNTANTQYAQQMMIVKLVEQNASIMDFTAAIHEETQTLILEMKKQQFEMNHTLRNVCIHLLEDRNALIQIKEAGELLSKELDRAVFACPRCGSLGSRNRRICVSCGELLNSENSSLTTWQAQTQYKEELRALSEVVRKIKETKGDVLGDKREWYRQRIKMIRRYAQEVQLTEEVQKKIDKACVRFEREMEKQCVEIAIAGTVKAGKSTLINALFDEEFCVTDPEPETSVLTRLYTTKGRSYLKVRFFNAKQWETVLSQIKNNPKLLGDYNKLKAQQYVSKWIGRRYSKECESLKELSAEIERFTSSRMPLHFLVRDVEVGVHSDRYPTDVCFVDTPGLNDAVEQRSKISKKYLNKADAILACILVKNLSQASESNFISSILTHSKDSNTVYVVGTQKDIVDDEEYSKIAEGFLNDRFDPMLNGYGDANSERKICAGRNYFGVTAKYYLLAHAFERGTLHRTDKSYKYLMRWAEDRGIEDEIEVFRRIEEVKSHTGIPWLRESLEKRLFEEAFKVKRAKLDEAFSDFQKRIDLFVAEGIGNQQENLDALDANQAQLEEKRQAVTEVEQMAKRIRLYMDRVLQRMGGES